MPTTLGGFLRRDCPGESISSLVQERYPSTLHAFAIVQLMEMATREGRIMYLPCTPRSPPPHNTVACTLCYTAMTCYISQHTCFKTMPSISSHSCLYKYIKNIGSSLSVCPSQLQIGAHPALSDTSNSINFNCAELSQQINRSN